MKEHSIKVSVIIPIYNVEKYIEKCLASATGQTLRDIEIVCVNDGSTDHSMDAVYEKAGDDGRIVIVEKKNGGLSSARNAGLDKARGEYVLFLDSDDALEQNALELLYAKASENRADNIFFGATTVYESLKAKFSNYRRYNRYYLRRHPYPEILPGAEMLCALVENGEYRVSACLQMLRRQFLVQKGIRFLEGILHEDNLFTLQVILGASRVMVVNEALYVRLVRSGSIMTAGGGVRSSWGYYACLSEMIRLARRAECSDRARESLNDVIMRTQRDAVLPIRGMRKEKVLEALGRHVGDAQRLDYEVMVLNGEWMRQQNCIWARAASCLGQCIGAGR